MKTRELLRLIWLNVTQNKFKTIMTSIGIVVGAATIVMVIAIGRGGQMEVAEQFKNLNAGAIDITYEQAESSTASRGGASTSESSVGTIPSLGGMGGMAGTGSGGFMQNMDTAGGGSQGSFPMSNGGSSQGGSSTSEGSSFQGSFPMSEGGTSGFDRNAEGGMSFPSFGGDFSSIFSGSSSDMSSRINQENITLSDSDVEDIEVFVPGISEVTISYTAKSDVDGGNLSEATSYTIAGVKANYAEVSNLTMAVGSFIEDSDEENKSKVCVLGAAIASELFGSAMEAYDSIIYIGDRSYVVNGILEKMGTVASGISPDDAIFIPYSTGIKYITGTEVSPTITVIAENVSDVDTVIEQVTSVLSESYPNAEFTFSDAGSKMEAASSSNETLTMLLYAMAAIVFLVGGIGIMNVLFVSVQERTNEIGILKAIGCTKKNILLEFLLEAGAISLIGGLLGVGVSFAVTPVVEYMGMRVEANGYAWVMALLFAVLTGTIFGLYPAWKASRLVPVEALNHE